MTLLAPRKAHLCSHALRTLVAPFTAFLAFHDTLKILAFDDDFLVL
jgi:hypothetical protein